MTLARALAIFAFMTVMTVESRAHARTIDRVTVPNLIEVPLFRQATTYTCGVASMQAVLRYFSDDEDYTEHYLAKKLKANSTDGTLYANIVRFAEGRGFAVETHLDMTLDDLQANVERGLPVIVLIQAWSEKPKPVDWVNDWDDGHFSVVVGYDSENVYLMDPSTSGHYTFIPTLEFLDRWHDIDGTTRVTHFGMVMWKEGPVYDRTKVDRMN